MTELLATCWTHSGNSFPLPGHDLSDLTLTERAEAVSSVGYRGIGIFIDDLRLALRTESLADIRSRLTDLGLVHVELEFLTDWWTTGPTREAADADKRFLLAAATELQARHVKIGAYVHKADDGAALPSLDIAMLAPALHDLGVDAEAHGTRLALEFLPMSNVSNVRDAVSLIDSANHPALGLCVDIWHAERGSTTLEDIAAIPHGMIAAVEINDAPRSFDGGPFFDTIHNRVMPGAGEFDIRGFVAAVRASGFDGPWGVEILSADWRRGSIQAELAEAYRTALPYVSEQPLSVQPFHPSHRTEG